MVPIHYGKEIIMQDTKDIEGSAKEQMIQIKKTHESLEKYVSNLKIISTNLEKLSGDITNFIAIGNANAELNRKLWHDLNNVDHQITQFTRFTEDSSKELAIKVSNLIGLLRSARPQV